MIYFLHIRSGERAGTTKVGTSVTPGDRIVTIVNTLQCAATLHAVEPGGLDEERDAHDALHFHRVMFGGHREHFRTGARCACSISRANTAMTLTSRRCTSLTRPFSARRQRRPATGSHRTPISRRSTPLVGSLAKGFSVSKGQSSASLGRPIAMRRVFARRSRGVRRHWQSTLAMSTATAPKQPSPRNSCNSRRRSDSSPPRRRTSTASPTRRPR